MNEFSILCRVLGSLYYRQPQDPLLVPLFTLIREGKLAASWPLEQDELLARLQKSCEMQSLATDYNALFVGEACSVPPYRSAWVEGSSEAEVRSCLSNHGIPTGEGPADHL
ncbi:TorD/DmsD family molecular chaperone, partial [Citrobacter freundii]|uniref:TorD/DmsD family molecular chaperone n=1 Tax=Citrobacter freundii TaxID=546 RepID=UPI001E32B436